jgi:multidrug efflux pump subunit AcrA (membrane-fusion protein)
MRRPNFAPRAALACAVAIAALPAAGASGKETPSAPPAGGLATMVVTAQAAPTERMLDGTVEAVNQSTVSAQTAGRVEAIFFDVNDKVPAGALIIRIRSTEQAASLTQAQAALKEATAREAEAQTRFERIADMYQRRVVAAPGSRRPARASPTRRSGPLTRASSRRSTCRSARPWPRALRS